MQTASVLAVSAFALTLAVVFWPVVLASAQNIECHDEVLMGRTPVGPWPFTTRRAARDAAIQGWIAECNVTPVFTPFQYSCDWSIAADRQERCNRVANGFGGYNHACFVRGRPCTRGWQ